MELYPRQKYLADCIPFYKMELPPRQKSWDLGMDLRRDGLLAWPCVETMDRVLAPGGVEADCNWKMKASVETMADVSPEARVRQSGCYAKCGVADP